MYRKDLMARAGITMPLHPTWTQVEQIAAELHQPKRGPVGICLRGLPGWGENLAPIDTVINTFGGRWFNTAWQAQMTSPEVTRAVSSYVSMVQKYGEPGAPESGFSECLTLYSQGGAAMWYDATSAVRVIEDPATGEQMRVAAVHIRQMAGEQQAARHPGRVGGVDQRDHQRGEVVAVRIQHVQRAGCGGERQHGRERIGDGPEAEAVPGRGGRRGQACRHDTGSSWSPAVRGPLIACCRQPASAASNTRAGRDRAGSRA